MGRVQVTFSLDADGLLSVAAKELSTGVEQKVEVKPSCGLTDDEVEEMLLASLDHAEEDVAKRLVAEARVEGQRILQDLTRALGTDAALLEPGERDVIEAAAAALRRTMEGSEHARITAAIGIRDHASATLRSDDPRSSALPVAMSRSADAVGRSPDGKIARSRRARTCSTPPSSRARAWATRAAASAAAPRATAGSARGSPRSPRPTIARRIGSISPSR
jgi:hypothetical protein